MEEFNARSDSDARQRAAEAFGAYQVDRFSGGRRPAERGRTAIWQARLVLFVMINVAQLWILSTAIEASLAGHYSQLVPLVVASAVCWAIGLTIYLWWKPASARRTSTGYVAKK